jgi:tetratricopeptide (TPR) repeat protein
MGLFDFFGGKPQVTEQQLMLKCMQAVGYYQKRDFASAARYFSEYFDLKGFGRFPRLDADDLRMYLNLMLSQFYSRNYSSCIETCHKILKLKPNSGDAYAFIAMSQYKLGNLSESDVNWSKAKSLGNQLASVFSSVSEVKMEGF